MGRWDFRFCGFGHFLNRVFGLRTKKLGITFFEYLVFSKKPCVFLDLAYDVVFRFFFFDLVYSLSSARMFSIMRPNHAPSS